MTSSHVSGGVVWFAPFNVASMRSPSRKVGAPAVSERPLQLAATLISSQACDVAYESMPYIRDYIRVRPTPRNRSDDFLAGNLTILPVNKFCLLKSFRAYAVDKLAIS
jgi:hypothetical protein